MCSFSCQVDESLFVFASVIPLYIRPSHKFNAVKKSLCLLAIPLHILPTVQDTSYWHYKMLFQRCFLFTSNRFFFFRSSFTSSEYIYFFFRIYHPYFLTSILFFIAIRSNGDFCSIYFHEKKKEGGIRPFSYAVRFNHLSKLILTTHAFIFPFSIQNRISRNPSIYKL